MLLSRTLRADESDALFRRIRARFDRASVQLSTVEVRGRSTLDPFAPGQTLTPLLHCLSPPLPLNQVRFQDINVSADVQVGQRATPTLLNSLRNVVDAALLRRANAQPFPILTDISGVLCPRRLTLLLGPAASGKSTLLHALAGRLHSTRRVPFSGDITYNGHGFADFFPERAAALVQQRDVHAGELTVRETLDFAARCQGCHTRQAELERLRQAEAHRGLGGEYDDPELDALMHAMAVEGQEHSVSTELMLRLLRLTKAADTVVGSPLLRGISGGEKKRLTLGEITVGGGALLSRPPGSLAPDSRRARSLRRPQGALRR